MKEKSCMYIWWLQEKAIKGLENYKYEQEK